MAAVAMVRQLEWPLGAGREVWHHPRQEARRTGVNHEMLEWKRGVTEASKLRGLN
jgi:hypothetical protein